MEDKKEILGELWIEKGALLQEVTSIYTNGKITQDVVVRIPNIWSSDQLTSTTEVEDIKTNGKGYFYWEFEMTDLYNDDVNVKVQIECPKPDYGIFSEPYDPDEYAENTYGNYWVTKLKESTENYENHVAIQRKNVTFKGSNYVNQNGELVQVEDTVFVNNDLGDITNLLNMF